jgi:PAS domain-containing protein
MFHHYFESTASAVWLFDPCTTTVVDCNEATVALMRSSSRDELVGKRAEELAPPLQPDGLTTVESLGRCITETMKKGYSRFDWMVSRFDRTEVPLEVIQH